MKLYPQMMTGPEPLGSTGSTRSTLAASSKRSRTVSRRSVDDPSLDEGTLLRILFDESDQVEGPPPTPSNSRPNRRRPTHHSAYWPTTTEAMDRLRQILSGHERIGCVWTGMTIRDPGEIGLIIGLDSGGASHLWNTVPVNPSARLHQGDRLVTDSLLERSRDRILAWWRLAYQEAPFRDRFFAEVSGYAFPSDQKTLQTAPDWERAFEVMAGWNRSCQVVHEDGQPGWNPYGERMPIEPLSRRQLARWPWRYDHVRLDDPIFRSPHREELGLGHSAERSAGRDSTSLHWGE